MPLRAACGRLGTTGDDVALVLSVDGGRVDLVVAAIRDDNTDADLSVIDHGYTVEVRAHGRLLVTARTLRWHIGRDFGPLDLRSMTLSFQGNLTTMDSRLVVMSAGRVAT